ncbi:MAG: carboxypeptidase-like regulatory domain-containing protein, partial [Bacteroidota bacterium]
MLSKLRFFLYIFLLCSLGLGAQTGTITGLITDAEDGSGLPGASVYIKDNAAVGTVTELEGTFRLINVPVGEQILIVSYIGFEAEERPVTVTEGGTVTIDVRLGGQAFMGEVVTVSAQALGQAKAINQQLNSDGVANFVSADKIKELPDVNAAEAISRLPGVAINRSGGEGSKIVVRGLDPKFTAININGTRLPSTSGSDRSVDLSLISPEL